MNIKPFTIYLGASHSAKEWTPARYTWEGFVQKFTAPLDTGESWEEFQALTPKEQNNLKSKAGAYVGGELENGMRNKKSVLSRSLLTLDADSINNLAALMDKLDGFGVKYILHSTRKSTPDNPRFRIIIPLKEDLCTEYYEPLVRMVCNELGIENFDKCSVEASRLMFFPTICHDGNYAYRVGEGDYFDAKAYLDSHYKNPLDINEWPLFNKEKTKDIVADRIKEAPDPREKEGQIGLFCRTYSVAEAIEEYLPDTYIPVDGYEDRFTYCDCNTAGGLVIYDNGLYAYSFHSSGKDPLYDGHIHNAFDVVRINKFGDGEDSMDKMLTLVAGDKNATQLRNEEAKQELDSLKDSEVDFGYGQNLELPPMSEVKKRTAKIKKILPDWNKKKTAPIQTIENAYQALHNDPYLKNFYYDEFANKITVCGDLPWKRYEANRDWNDNTDDSELKRYLEKYYGLTTEKKIELGLNCECNIRSIHPVKEYLNSLKWDGKKRIPTILIDYMGAEDNVYTREAIEKFLVASVARIKEPGIKFDCMLILAGKQGIGKSTLLSKLAGKEEWFSDTDFDLDKTDAYLSIQRIRIYEFAELTSFSKKDMEKIKSFITSTSDDYRKPYGKRTERNPRVCIFSGTTNKDEFLRDYTGNRRFWPITCNEKEIKKSVFDDLDQYEIDQIQAEAVELYKDYRARADEKGDKFIDLRLSPRAENIANTERDSRLERDVRSSDVLDYINIWLPPNWREYDIHQRLAFYGHEKPEGDDTKQDILNTSPRKAVMVKEFATEYWGIPSERLTKVKQNEIRNIMDSLPYLEWKKNIKRDEGPSTSGYLIDWDKVPKEEKDG